MDLTSKRQTINKLLGEFVSHTSEGFMELSAVLKEHPESSKRLDKLFRKLMEFNRSLSGEFQKALDELEKAEQEMVKISDERKKLEKLYSSGILFQSETDMKALMEKAIDTVVKELSADEGFIVLINAEKEIDTIVAKNMDPDHDPTTKELSTSIVRETIEKIAPMKIDDARNDEDYAKQNSIISLGLTSAITVPLVSGSKILGVVYIDKRNKEEAFKESDLAFLISFARQIVKGMQISLEISQLEDKIAEKPKVEFEELRKSFKSDEIIGTGKKIFNVLKLASRVAETDASILLLGENGTGKDLLARAIHNNSGRSSRPFVAVNCGAIPSELLESELFGYESGAFTGAVKSKPGRLETAEGGTIFLDEIGEMSVNLQAKLLRVIQTKEIERLGGISSKKIDVRFIAATNKDISKMIEEKLFREDLYYRLKVIEIKVPPLHERREDIEELSKFFLKKHSQDNNNLFISDSALEILESYNWPGNIRELENVIQRCVILAKSNVINDDDLPPEIIDKGKEENFIEFGTTLSNAENEFRRMYLIKVLRKAGSKSEAAKMLGINRSHLHKLIAQLGIND